MESAFEAGNCTAECKVWFATSTFRDAALSWWNGYANTRSTVAANILPWETLKIMMMEEYCPRSVRQNTEHELRNLTMRGSDLEEYTKHFNNLATLCPDLVLSEQRKVECYVKGLTPQLQKVLVSYRPTTLEGVKIIVECFAHQYSHSQTENPKAGNNKPKRWGKNEGSSCQAPIKRQKVVATVAVAPVETSPSSKPYTGTRPKCNKCPYHHFGACRELVCHNCQMKGHTTRYCRNPPMVGTNPTLNDGTGRMCYGCQEIGHYKRDCPQARTKEGGGD